MAQEEGTEENRGREADEEKMEEAGMREKERVQSVEGVERDTGVEQVF